MFDRYLTAEIVDNDTLSASVDEDAIEADIGDSTVLGDPTGKYIPIPSIAKEGQTIVVETVDDNGRPTKWKATDFPKSGVLFTTDKTLKLSADNVLSVNTTNDAEKDNTLPITSAGVAATVGNIEIILKTI